MPSLLYKAIKTEKQYNEYTIKLTNLLDGEKRSKDSKDVIDLLTALLEHYDKEYNTFGKTDPVALLHFLMEENDIKVDQMSGYLYIREELVSDILNYRLGFSKPIIRKLAGRFKMKQEAFSKHYILVNAAPNLAKKITGNNKVRS